MGPAYLCVGGSPGMLRSEHFSLVTQAFPRADIVTLPGAGHDVHVEDKPGFLFHIKGVS